MTTIVKKEEGKRKIRQFKGNVFFEQVVIGEEKLYKLLEDLDEAVGLECEIESEDIKQLMENINSIVETKSISIHSYAYLIDYDCNGKEVAVYDIKTNRKYFRESSNNSLLVWNCNNTRFILETVTKGAGVALYDIEKGKKYDMKGFEGTLGEFVKSLGYTV